MNRLDGGTVIPPAQAWLNCGKPCGRCGGCPGRGNASVRPRGQTPSQTVLEKKQVNDLFSSYLVHIDI